MEQLETRLALSVQAAFAEVSSALGLTGMKGGSGEYHSGGMTFTDLTNDGYADLFLIGAQGVGSRLFINVDDGAGGREYIRAVGDGGLAYAPDNSTGSVAADYDNDGDLDVYLTNFKADNILFKNMWVEDHPVGGGDSLADVRFVDVTASTDPTPANPVGDNQHGLKHATFQNPNPVFGNDTLDNTLAAAWADVNRDGWVDIYVGSWDGTNGDPGSGEDGQLGERDTLYLNNGDGTFTDVTMASDGSPFVPPTPTGLMDDGSFELATHDTQTSNSSWVMTTESDGTGESAVFQTATFAASDGDTGVWFKGFEGSVATPVDAQVTQVVTATDTGDYTLTFDAKAEANFASVVGGFQVTITSDGTGGSDTIDILTAAPDFLFNTYTLNLTGVTAGDNLTIVAEMIDATGGPGPDLSGMVDLFVLTVVPDFSGIDDGSFELAFTGTQTSNSAWVMTTEFDGTGESAVFQTAPWASSNGTTGVWFQGFKGTAATPVDAQVTQVVTVTDPGDYTLTFDAKVEENFASVVGGFNVTITSDGTGGSDTIDLLAAAPDFGFNSYTLNLTGVTAGDNLTIVAEMIDAAGDNTGALRSSMVDKFALSVTSPIVAPLISDWEQVGGWQYSDGSFVDPSLPAEFSGQNGLQFADFNNDGWQDLIVSTMGGGGPGPNRDMLYINRGLNGSGEWLGYHMVSYEIGFGGSESSDMGVTVADVDNDGDLDYFSTLLPDAHPLWINNLVQTGSLSFTRTTLNNDFGWGANFHDFDNNGRVDLVVSTDVARRKGPADPSPSPTSYLHMQETNGTFDEQGVSAGLTSLYSRRTVAVADFDRDGWSEFAQWTRPELNSPGIVFYQNNSAALNPNFHFLTLELEGDPTLPGQFKSTRDAIGARAYVTADFDGSGVVDADETRMEEVLSGHSNASTTSSLALEFGLGEATTADVRVVWGSGRETIMNGVTADQFLSIVEQQTLDADFDGNNEVDGIDFLTWQRNFGTQAPNATLADGDADGDKDVDADDLTVWENSYGVGQVSLVEASSVEPQTASVAQSSVATQSVDVGESVLSDNLPANILLSLSDPSVGSESAIGRNDVYFSSLDKLAEHSERHLNGPAIPGPYVLGELVNDFTSLTADERSSDGNSETDLAFDIMEEDELPGLLRPIL